jgi:hypothetical protein
MAPATANRREPKRHLLVLSDCLKVKSDPDERIGSLTSGSAEGEQRAFGAEFREADWTFEADVVGSCNIVQGFRDAGDTLFPEVKTYREAPGFRLVSGSFRSMTLVASSELFLIARPPEESTSLYSMRYADPKPCELEDVGCYWAGGSEGFRSLLHRLLPRWAKQRHAELRGRGLPSLHLHLAGR